MANEKRNIHTYKATDKDYLRAFKKAKRNGAALATLIEEFVINYGKPVKKIKGVNLPEDFLTIQNIGVLNDDGTVTPIDVKDMSLKMNVIAK